MPTKLIMLRVFFLLSAVSFCFTVTSYDLQDLDGGYGGGPGQASTLSSLWMLFVLVTGITFSST